MNSCAFSTPLRKRSTNFSKEEELILLEEVDKLKGIVECKMSNKVTIQEKCEAWSSIELNFNSKTNTMRTLDQLKAKYENLKTKARKSAAQNKTFYKKTGGGPSQAENSDPVTESVLNIISAKTVFGLQNTYDCDADQEINMLPLQKKSGRQVNEKIVEPNLDPSSSVVLDADQEILEFEMGSEEPKPGSSASTKRTNNWSSYTPNKLKEPVSKKLRPTVLNPVITAKEEYYKTKTALLKFELEDRKERAEREKEEHELKIMLLRQQLEQSKNKLNN